MNALFLGGPDLAVSTRDLRNFVLVEPKYVQTDDGRDYKMPAGATSDGTSEPQFLWSLGLAPFGPEGPASVFHDCAYRGTLLIKKGLEWVPAMLTKDEADELYLALMFSLGVSEKRRNLIFEGVSKFGWKAFREDREVLETDA